MIDVVRRTGLRLLGFLDDFFLEIYVEKMYVKNVCNFLKLEDISELLSWFKQ